MSRRALLTGGAGFIGSHLATALLDDGWAVDVLDDLSTGRLQNIAPLRERPRFSFVEGSAADRRSMEGLVARADVIFHLAAAVGVRLVVERPVHTIETNLRATETALEFAATRRIPFLLASSSEVYGKLDGHRFNEEDDVVLGPSSKSRWSYAASKLIDEFLTLAYARERALPATVVRLFNTIGPRQTGRYGMVVPRFVEQALRGQPITVYGDGTQRRSFTWVGDVVTALIKLAHYPGAAGQVYNVGHVKDIAIVELAELVKRLVGSSSEIQRVPFEEAYDTGFEDMERRLPDISKLGQAIGYRPTLDLPDMLRRIIAHFRAELSLPGPLPPD